MARPASRRLFRGLSTFYIASSEGVPVDKWQYCEVFNMNGKVSVRQLKQDGNGLTESKSEERGVHNMARVLAALAQQGWEVIQVSVSQSPPQYSKFSYVSVDVCSIAFLKRRIEEPTPHTEAQTEPAHSR
jgi:hypothetical protein